jgi:hypothetical protein
MPGDEITPDQTEQPAPIPEQAPPDNGVPDTGDPTKPYDFNAALESRVAQIGGAQKALLASSMAHAVTQDPDQQAKIQSLAGKLGVSSDVVAQDYDAQSQRMQVASTDYTRLTTEHPELAQWLSVRDNAAISHDEIPQMTEMDRLLKGIGGRDATGILPPGYLFQENGSIRGPLHEDGTPPVVYPSLATLSAAFKRQESLESSDQAEQAAEDQQMRGLALPNLEAGTVGSLGQSLAAAMTAAEWWDRKTGGDHEFNLPDFMGGGNAEEVRQVTERFQAAARRADPGIAGVGEQMVGQVMGDAPLLLAGGLLGDVAKEGLSAVNSLRTLRLTSLAGRTAIRALNAVPVSNYLADIWRTAAIFAPIGVRSGINSAAQHGESYGTTDFILNTFIPAALGSRLGIPAALLPKLEEGGAEAADAAESAAKTGPQAWLPYAAKLSAHIGFQGSVYAATELSLAIHEYMTGVDKHALDIEDLAPRLAQAGVFGATDKVQEANIIGRMVEAGFRGGATAGAFHILRDSMERTILRKQAADRAMRHADQVGSAIETAQAMQTPDRSPDNFQDLIDQSMPENVRLQYMQPEDFHEVAKAAQMTPEDLAAKFNISQQYRDAMSTGKTLQIPTSNLIAGARDMEDPGVKAVLHHLSDNPDGLNVKGALQFYEDMPDEIQARKEALKSDVTEQASKVSTGDPIFQDVMAKASESGGASQDEARQIAKLTAARFNTMVRKFNEDPESLAKRGGKLLDPFEEYQKFQLAIERARPGMQAYEAMDAYLNRLRTGDIPSDRQVYGKSLMEDLRGVGVKDDTGELGRMGVDEHLKPGQGKLIDPTGHDLETAAQHAFHKGYLPDEQVATLMNALREEMNGHPVFNRENPHAQLGPIHTMLTGLQDELRSKGIDLGKESNQQIKAKLSGERGPAVATYSQRPIDLVVKGRRVVETDVPYAAGSSKDGKTVYIDRRIPRFAEIGGKRIDLWKAIAEHEIKEKQLLDQGEHYSQAHLTATHTEDADVDHQGVSHEEYERFLKPYIDQARKEADPTRVPADIEDKPYRDMGEEHLIKGRGLAYLQGSGEGPRGSTSFDASRHFTITLSGNADLSTLAHEATHFWFETMGDYAMREDAPRSLRNDYLKLLEWSGYGTHEGKLAAQIEHRGILESAQRENRPLTEAETKRIGELSQAHEKVADAFVDYLREGVAPDPSLRGVFQRFRIWLTDLVKQFGGAFKSVDPEIRAIFDRSLATDQAIQEAHKDLGFSTIFKDQASSGMKDPEWSAYLTAIEKERTAANARVFAAAMKTLRSQNTKTYARERDAVRWDATQLINQQPVYQAENALVHGLDPDGNVLATAPKLDAADVERHFPKSIGLLLRGITTRDGTGLPLQTAAERFGFRTGAQLWEAMNRSNFVRRKEAIEQQTERIMQVRHPEMTQDAMVQAAMDAVHENAAHADVLNRESAALAIKANRRPIRQEEFRALAQQMIELQNHRDVDADTYLRAEKKYSDEATKQFLLANPNYTAAFLAKQHEEMAHASYRAAMEAEDVIEDTSDLMKTMAGRDARSMLGKVGGYVVTGKNGERLITTSADEAMSFAKEYEGTTESFLAHADRMTELWKDKPTRYDLQMGAVADLRDDAASLLYKARQANRIMVAGKQEELDQAIGQALKTQEEAIEVPDFMRPKDVPRIKGPAWQLGKFFRDFDAGNRTLAGIAKSLDGEQVGGWHWEHLVRPLNEAGNSEDSRDIADKQAMRDLFKTWGKSGRKDTVLIPSIGEHMDLETRVGFMLNAGTVEGMERMRTGDHLTNEQIRDVINTLDEKDVALVQGIWDHVGSKWPEVSATYQRINGVPPVKAKEIPVRTKFGTIDGKYYPILYDKEVSSRAMEISLDRFAHSLTGKLDPGFAKSRVDTTGMRLQYGFQALFRHLDDTSHYLSHADAADSVNKIVSNPLFAASVIRRFGRPTYEMMMDRIKNAVQGPIGPRNAVERATKILRLRTGLATTGYNAMTFVAHGFGVFQNMERVGAGKYLAAEGQLLASARDAQSGYQFIASKSELMRNYRYAMTPESAERLRQGPVGGTLQTIQDHAYDSLHFALNHINSATWLAEYKSRLAEDPDDEGRAIALADQAVRDTQGTGQSVDKTHFQDANEYSKMLMQYLSFFTRTYQSMRPAVVGVTKDPKTLIPLAKASLMLLSLPVVTEAMFRQLVVPSQSSQTDSVKWWAERLVSDHLEYLLSTMVGGRELYDIALGHEVTGPAAMRSMESMSGLVRGAKAAFTDPTPNRLISVARTAAIVGGGWFGLPANQVDKIIRGIAYDSDQSSFNPAPVLFGPPPK